MDSLATAASLTTHHETIQNIAYNVLLWWFFIFLYMIQLPACWKSKFLFKKFKYF